MSKTLLALKHPQYTYVKNGIYYYSRQIPKDLTCHYSKRRIIKSLRTKSSLHARTASRALTSKLEQYWLGLRVQSFDVPSLDLVISKSSVIASNMATLREALDIYFKVKGEGRTQHFFDTANRNIQYVVKCLGDKSLDEYQTKDATKLRDWLIQKGLGHSSLQRIFSGVKAVINFAILELGLNCSNAFSKVYLPSSEAAKVRHPISANNLTRISKKCLELNDDLRWLVAMILDSGMRLSEAAGLMISDIKLDAAIPHILLQPHLHRRLKTSSSKRIIPLIGMSLWSAHKIVNKVGGDYCFPRYTNSSRCNSNSASAALNKWIKSVGGNNDVIHGLRHSFRDRLRAVEAPSDMIDQLGGWTLRTVGQGYGKGYDLDLLHKYMKSIEINS
jgi:integrase